MAPRSRSIPRPSREERRDQLLDAAVEAIRAIGPNASMEQLAAQGGVTKPILYRHFGDREGLSRAIGERYATVLMERITTALGEGEPRELLWRTIDAYLQFLEDDPQLYAYLTNATGARPDLEHAGAMVQGVAREVAVTIGDQLRAAGLDAGGAEPFAFGIVGMIHQAGDWWIRSRTMSRDALTTYLATLLWSGFQGLGQAAAEAAAVPNTNLD